jgi:hypothetical protein
LFCIKMSSQAHPLKHICELNAHGILALAQGRPGKSSVLTLREAMVALDLLCSVSAKGFVHSADLPFAFRTVPVPGLNDRNFYIVDNAILVSPAMILNGTTELTSTNMAVLCAILTFNTALAYHQAGRRSGHSGKMKIAYRLYGNCIEMASSVEDMPHRRVGDALSVLYIVAMNNAAQIQYALANFADSDQLMAQVRRSMLELLDNAKVPEPYSSETDLLAMLPSECLHEINLNAAVCTRPSTAPTA